MRREILENSFQWTIDNWQWTIDNEQLIMDNWQLIIYKIIEYTFRFRIQYFHYPLSIIKIASCTGRYAKSTIEALTNNVSPICC